MNKTNKRIGPRMTAIRNYVSAHPDTTILASALATRPTKRSRHMSGYAAAWRAVRAGIITATPGTSNSYKLRVAV